MIEINVVIQAIIAISGVIGVAYTIIKDKLPTKTRNLRGVKSILNRREKIRSDEKYLQDLELNAIPCLKGFKWIEADVLLDKNIGMLTLSNLRALSRRKLLVVYDDKIVLPTKRYVIKTYFRDPISYLLAFNFTVSIVALFYSFYTQPSEIFWHFSYFVYIFSSEVIILYHFDSLISLNLLEESGDIAGNDILISQDFDKELRLYDIYKLQQHQKKLDNKKPLVL